MGGNLKKQLAPLALLLMLIIAVSIPAIADDSDQGVSDPSAGYTNASAPTDVTTIDDGNVSTDRLGDVVAGDGTDAYNETDVEPVDVSLSDGSDESSVIAPVDYTCGYYGTASCADNVRPACTKQTAAVNATTNPICNGSSSTTRSYNKSTCNKK